MDLHPVYRVTTFVPPEHLEAVLAALARVTPLTYGPYDHSAWWSGPGTEQFCPRPGAKPTLGRVGQIERTPTIRLEFAIPRDEKLVREVLGAIRESHPWQVPAIFIDESTAAVAAPA